MITTLHNYDIYPKVFLTGKEVGITIKPLGWHAAFDPDYEYTVTVRPVTEGEAKAERTLYTFKTKPCADGCIRFKNTFAWEAENFVRIIKDDKEIARLFIYALDRDMAGRYPYLGDFHMHTRRSDGSQAPAIVCANYRKAGYDFFAITDHHRYYPSLEAQRAYKDVPIDFTVVEGEEVHLPGNPIHIINFGGDYSINGLVKTSAQYKEKGEDISERAIIKNPPKTLSLEEYTAEINALIPELNIPDYIDKFAYAACVWAYRHIRAGHGLGVFCHPYWITDVYQIAECFTDYMLDTMPCDAFEVVGGEMYYEQNGFQTAKYYEHRAKGQKIQIVGSSDSHNSIPCPDAYVGQTIVFSKGNEKKAIIESVKNLYDVAVDRMSAEPRLIGDFRFVKYGSFLLKNYFPLHDDLCYEEGSAMKAYVCGDETAAEDLSRTHGRTERLLKKYFAIE